MPPRRRRCSTGACSFVRHLVLHPPAILSCRSLARQQVRALILSHFLKTNVPVLLPLSYRQLYRQHIARVGCHCRCVLNWFGDWSNGALYQVGKEFTSKIDLERSNVSSSTRAINTMV